MTVVASALVALAFWFALSVASLPVLVLCVRSQQRANARRTARMRRDGWVRASAR